MVYEKAQALRHELWKRSPEGRRLFHRYWMARNDAGFQAFKQRFIEGLAPRMTNGHD